MANAKEQISRVVKEEGGYQADKADTGNFYHGQLYGTKFGITPAAWQAFYKKPLQQDTIKNLTVPEVIPIYKKNYWDKIRGDEIANEATAGLMMFVIVNSGTGTIKSLKAVANMTAGKKIMAETYVPFTKEEIALLNKLPADKYFNNLKLVRKKFYEALAKKDPNKQKYLKGWLSRLDKHQYSGRSSGNSSTLLLSLGAVLLLGAGGAYAWFEYPQVRRLFT